MAKLLLQLQAAADRRHGGGLGLGLSPNRRHPLTPRHAPGAAGRFALFLLGLVAAATTLALALTMHRHAPPDPADASPR